jgi:hypothetical protein
MQPSPRKQWRRRCIATFASPCWSEADCQRIPVPHTKPAATGSSATGDHYSVPPAAATCCSVRVLQVAALRAAQAETSSLNSATTSTKRPRKSSCASNPHGGERCPRKRRAPSAHPRCAVRAEVRRLAKSVCSPKVRSVAKHNQNGAAASSARSGPRPSPRAHAPPVILSLLAPTLFSIVVAIWASRCHPQMPRS